MPLYSYRCQSCRNTFEVLQKSPDSHNPSCPSCGDDKIFRLLPVPAPPVVKDNPTGGCCGAQGGCESPKKCCERE